MTTFGQRRKSSDRRLAADAPFDKAAEERLTARVTAPAEGTRPVSAATIITVPATTVISTAASAPATFPGTTATDTVTVKLTSLETTIAEVTAAEIATPEAAHDTTIAPNKLTTDHKGHDNTPTRAGNIPPCHVKGGGLSHPAPSCCRPEGQCQKQGCSREEVRSSGGEGLVGDGDQEDSAEEVIYVGGKGDITDGVGEDRDVVQEVIYVGSRGEAGGGGLGKVFGKKTKLVTASLRMRCGLWILIRRMGNAF